LIAGRAGAVGVVFLCAGHVCAQDITLSGPASAGVGSELEVRFEGAADPRDFITIMPIDAAEGHYDAYTYARENPVKLQAPSLPGNYEVRYLGAATPYPTRARQPITVIDVAATLTAPAEVRAGQEFAVVWEGPDNARDFIGLVSADAAEGTYAGPYDYTQKGSPLTLRAPDAPGSYELRYMLGSSPYRTLGRLRVTVTGATATLSAPASVAAGSAFEVAWQGPGDAQDFIAIVPAGAPERAYDAYEYTARGNPVELNAPEIAGDYEVRYLTGQTYATLTSAAFTVTPVTASLEAPPMALARDVVTVTWEGPGNPTDYVTLVPVGSAPQVSGNYAYVTRGATLRIATPDLPGDYELRYLTGGQRIVLATRAIAIAPRSAPGQLRVVDEGSAAPTLEGATVAVIVDASGSMLQRIEGERRIDIAKAAVSELVTQVLPESVPFTLRVFGHKEADSCRTDLELPVAPLDRAAAAARIASIEAMNLARTPIGASLKATAADIAGRPGPKLIILVTDGEETCDGDPAGAIRELAANGTEVRVNIVGFAIDELMLQETFAEWARLGNGKYFNARDRRELAASLRESIEVPFSVLDANGDVVATGTVNGAPVAVDAGTYRVTTLTDPVRSVDGVGVQMDQETRVALPAAP
jgi:hypothetical protein